MFQKQHTLKSDLRFEGSGLHTGEPASVLARPGEENSGIIFVRTDLPGNPEFRAVLDNVVDCTRSTTIGEGEATVQTVEHLLAALTGLQIDNAVIEVDGAEMPALDGSAMPYVAAIEAAGLAEQHADRAFIELDEPVHFSDPERQVDLAAVPADDYRLSVTIDYNSEVLGVQHAQLNSIEAFAKEIAPNRTFCFWHEVQHLLNQGLIQGGALDNAVVIVENSATGEELKKVAGQLNLPDLAVGENGVLNNIRLHFDNEPARHKLLDLIGDLSLLGSPLKGRIFAAKPGHAANVAFAKKIQAEVRKKQIIRKFQKDENKEVVFDINAIANILPHRYPFLLVDRITEFSEEHIVGYKNVTRNEPFFNGHFPGNPIMPGVLILESMAQVGGILFLNIIDNPQDYWVYFIALNKVRFKKPVTPGDKLVFRLEMTNLKRNIIMFDGKALVDDKVVCQAEIVASLVKK